MFNYSYFYSIQAIKQININATFVFRLLHWIFSSLLEHNPINEPAAGTSKTIEESKNRFDPFVRVPRKMFRSKQVYSYIHIRKWNRFGYYWATDASELRSYRKIPQDLVIVFWPLRTWWHSFWDVFFYRIGFSRIACVWSRSEINFWPSFEYTGNIERRLAAFIFYRMKVVCPVSSFKAPIAMGQPGY